MEDTEIYVLYRIQEFSEADVEWVGVDKEEALIRLHQLQSEGGYSIQVWKDGKKIAEYYEVEQTLTFVGDEK